MPETQMPNSDPITNGNFFLFDGAGNTFTQGGIPNDIFGPNFIVKFSDPSPFRSVEELWFDRAGTPMRTDLHRVYVRHFRVLVKSKMFGPGFICRCPGLPVPYAPYIPYRVEEYDPQARAIQIEAAQDPQSKQDDWQSWIVTVSYSTEMPLWGHLFGKQKLGWDYIDGVQNKPWLITPHKEWDTETFTVYPFVDLDNKPYQNAAGQPFQPPHGVTKGFKTVTITRYEKDFETRNEDYVYVSNESDFLGSPKGYALCLGPRAQEMFIGTIKYHKVTYRVQLKKRISLGAGNYTDGFNPVRILNQGMYQKASFFGQAIPGGGLAPIVRFGHQATHPVLLTTTGLEKTERNADGFILPNYIERKEYREVDLNVLLNPQS